MLNLRARLQHCLKKYPFINWIIIGFIGLMLIISSIGFIGIAPVDHSNTSVRPEQTVTAEEAQKEVERWLYKVKEDPSPFNYRQLARLYKDSNQLDKSLEAGLKAKELDPNNITNSKLLVEVYMRINDMESATEELRHMVELEPNNMETRLNLAMSLQFYSKNSKDAIAEYEKILEMKPDSKEVRQLLIMAYMDNDMNDKAEKELKWLADSDPNNVSVISTYADLYARQKKYDEAITYYNKAIAIDPNQVPFYSGLAGAYKDKGDVDKAIETYNKLLLLYPKDTKAFMDLASLYEKQGKKDEAIKQFERARLIAEEQKDDKLKETINKEIDRLSGKTKP